MRRPAATAAVMAALATLTVCLGGCALGKPTGVVTNPPGTAIPATATPTTAPGTPAPQTSGERTVLAQEGLRIHSGPSLSDTVLGTASWGVALAVTGYNAVGGGFYSVQGATVTGWITADPTLSASGNLNAIALQDKDISGVLYPEGWTFADDPGEVVFTPEGGSDLPTLVIRTGTSQAALGTPGLPGYSQVSEDDQVVACGYTGSLTEYEAPPAATAEPTVDAGGGAVHLLPHFAQYQVEVTSSFWLDIEMNYATDDQLAVFDNAYNSIRFPFPQCEQPAPTATPSAAS
ncbi:MAG: SH3 domain-containing protein [Candidatus Dormibacteria bacterium]|jgi:hypothetical protein